MKTAVARGPLQGPIVYDLSAAEMIAARKAMQERAYGKGFNPFIIFGLLFVLDCVPLALQLAHRFARYGYWDPYAWAMIALGLVVIGLGAIATLIQLHPRTRQMSVTIGDDGIVVNRTRERAASERLTPWKKVRAVYVFDAALVIASGLRTTIIPTRALSDAAALEAFLTRKLTGDRYLSLGNGRRRTIVNTNAR